MPKHRVEQVTGVLRERTRDAIEMGALRPGDRLPGTRRLAKELNADPRIVLLALRRLAQEGLVKLRPRSGVYVSEEVSLSLRSPLIPALWGAEVIAQAVERGIPADKLGSLLTTTTSRKIRAAVVAATSDQAIGIVRELQDDYGMAAAAVFPSQLQGRPYPAAIARAQLLVTTVDLAHQVAAVASPLGKRLIVVRVRPDLFSEDWIAFMKGPVFVIVADPLFKNMLKGVLERVPGSRNVTVLLARSDDLKLVPRDARTYVTESARRMLGRAGLPGRVIRPRRILSRETVRELVTFLVAHNSSKAGAA